MSFEVFVRPALLSIQGRTTVRRRTLRLTAATGLRSRPGRRQYVPVALTDDGIAPAAAPGSHRAGALGRAVGYAVIAEDRDDILPGDPVDVMLVS